MDVTGACDQIKIKKAEPGDAKIIQEIVRAAFKKYVKDAGITEKINALTETIKDIKNDIRTKEVFIASFRGVPAGTIRVEIKPDNTAFITRFGVLPEYQNNGIGKALLNHADKQLVSRGIKKVYLHTASRYRELICFYYNMGFYVDSTTKDRGYTRVLMVKEYFPG
ncbi:MAG: GNAT family N-acetyltransferase [Clostridiaceae bacterium]|nr:GNAT family N-acetyltransferase [Clostridiaceae bacterium]